MNQDKTRKMLLAVAMLLFVGLIASIGSSYSVGPNYRNVSIDTTVNITDSKPVVLSVIVDNGANNITLNAGMSRTVTCNASIRDFNGGGTLANVTAVFYDNVSVTYDASDDNNTHYSNTSCAQTAVNGYFANYTCTFPVQYYANPSSWLCNVTAADSYDFNGTEDYAWNFNETDINTLYALNVTAQIDYGNLAVEDTSTAQEANVTNFGNVPINVSVYGYGQSVGDGLAMVCDVGNISAQYQKYSLNATDDFDTQYTSLTASGVQIGGLTVAQQTNDVQQEINQTYWRLYVAPNPFGICNGTIVFQAEAS